MKIRLDTFQIPEDVATKGREHVRSVLEESVRFILLGKTVSFEAVEWALEERARRQRDQKTLELGADLLGDRDLPGSALPPGDSMPESGGGDEAAGGK